MNKKKFTVKDDQGNDLVLAVVRPTPKQFQEAQLEYNKAFFEALESKAILRIKLDSVLRKQGLWDDDRQAQLDKIRKTINDGEKQLLLGRVNIKSAYKTAIKLREARAELATLLIERNSLDNMTADAQAENRKFDYLVSCCIVNNETGKSYYKNYDDYKDRATETAAYEGARILSSMIYGLDDDFEKKLPENEFLVNYGFANEDLRLINKDGKLIDADGRLIDKNGRFIDEDGKYVDFEGDPVDENGRPIVDFTPFLDDDGNPVVPKKTKVDADVTVAETSEEMAYQI